MIERYMKEFYNRYKVLARVIEMNGRTLYKCLNRDDIDYSYTVSLYSNWGFVYGMQVKVNESLNDDEFILSGDFYSMAFNNYERLPEIKDVIFNGPATIIKWKDGTKTVVKAQDEAVDAEKGLAMAIIKKMNKNKGNYNDIFRKWCNDDGVSIGVCKKEKRKLKIKKRV